MEYHFEPGEPESLTTWQDIEAEMRRIKSALNAFHALGGLDLTRGFLPRDAGQIVKIRTLIGKLGNTIAKASYIEREPRPPFIAINTHGQERIELTRSMMFRIQGAARHPNGEDRILTYWAKAEHLAREMFDPWGHIGPIYIENPAKGTEIESKWYSPKRDRWAWDIAIEHAKAFELAEFPREIFEANKAAGWLYGIDEHLAKVLTEWRKLEEHAATGLRFIEGGSIERAIDAFARHLPADPIPLPE